MEIQNQDDSISVPHGLLNILSPLLIPTTQKKKKKKILLKILLI